MSPWRTALSWCSVLGGGCVSWKESPLRFEGKNGFVETTIMAEHKGRFGEFEGKGG